MYEAKYSVYQSSGRRVKPRAKPPFMTVIGAPRPMNGVMVFAMDSPMVHL